MKRVLLAVALVAMLAMCVSAQATGWYFAQDDFLLKFGTPGQPGSAGGTIGAHGRLLNWDENTLFAYFKISAKTTLGAQPYAVGKYITWYDIATLDIYDDDPVYNPAANLMWTGTGQFCTIVNADGSKFPASSFDRPAYENQPVEYMSVGYGSFAGTGMFYLLNVDWLGTYNWNYDSSNPAKYQKGNMQAKVSNVIPEAGSVMLGMMGLGSVLGFVRFRKK